MRNIISSALAALTISSGAMVLAPQQSKAEYYAPGMVYRYGHHHHRWGYGVPAYGYYNNYYNGYYPGYSSGYYVPRGGLYGYNPYGGYYRRWY